MLAAIKLVALLGGLIVGFVVVMPTGAAGKNDEDAVVDQLEQQLLEEERASMPSKQQRFNSSTRRLPGGQTRKGQGGQYPPSHAPHSESVLQGHTSIEGQPSELQSLQGVKQEMAQLQAEIDALTTEVAQLQQTFLQQAQIDNLVAIEIITDHNEGAQLQSLHVKMDGQLIYEMTADAGLWLPEKIIDLFQGPMDPGVHRLDISARAAMKEPGNIPLQQEVYRFINKSFELDVPVGRVRKKWSVKVQAPQGEEGQVTAVISEGALAL